MSEEASRLHELAARAGVGRSYKDAFNRTIEIEDEDVAAVLRGLGLETEGGTGALEASLDHVQSIRGAMVAALLPAQSGAGLRVGLASAATTVEWRLTDEAGQTRSGRLPAQATATGAFIDLPASAAGYHTLEVTASGRTGRSLVIAAPPQCFLPEALRDPARGFGLTTQVYGLRSDHNFGMGDLGDVARLAEGAGALGASFLGLSPLHALFAADRTKISPYSPSSRLFVDPLFINARHVPGFATVGAAFLAAPDVARRLNGLRQEPFVDHAGVWALKGALLDKLWRAFPRTELAAFDGFRHEGGEALARHATFEALSARFRNEGKHWLGEWPEAFRRADSDAVRAFAAEAPDEIAFHAWLQWIADRQLADAHRAARAAGMPIGLYRDLAVGADSAGSEVWAHPDRFAPSLAVGAPPDPLGPTGQNWGLPPFNPLQLEAQGLAAFRDLVKANMRHAGAIRIDHAFQLQRLFLIPQGRPAAAGAYVDYPFAAMLAVLRLESHRARALIIAEDLGNAPDGFSDAIMKSGVLSYRILPFEREDGGRFKRPAIYPRGALSAMTTHDLPTFAGWWQGLDVDLRETFAIYDPATAMRERDGRRREIAQFCEALHAEALLPSADVPQQAPFEAGLRYLARTTSLLAAVQIEDVVGELNQANLPGQELGHPNWRRRLSEDLENVLAPGGPLAKSASALATENRHLGPLPSRLAAPPPRATYRLQFHKDFTFDDAVRIAPYLARLGISHVYASPLQKARPGSTHGYDNVDPRTINPELGGADGFDRLVAAIKGHGLKLLLDIVPNHMGVGGSDNHWWLSVLEWGEISPYADTFDIDWERLGANGKLVAPFLGGHYGDVLEKGDLKLAFDADDGSFSVWHYEHRFPICPLTYSDVLDRATAAEADSDGSGGDALLRISEQLRAMAADLSRAPDTGARCVAACAAVKVRIAAAAKNGAVRQAIEHAVKLVNGIPGRPERFGTLHRLLERQSYRLAYWRVAASDVNYRRFFDIDTLAGIRIENPDVFARVHETIFDLVGKGSIDGLRIDHVDGLADPKAYAEALQSAVGPGFYVVAEKILEPGETLRPWPIAGTTGYDTLNLIDGVLIDPDAEAAFDSIYRDAVGVREDYQTALLAAKRQVLSTSFSSELESLVSDLKRVADADRRTRDFTANAIRHALADIVVAFPVYRTYIVDKPVEEDRTLVGDVLARAKELSALPDRSVHDFACAALLGDLPSGAPGQAAPEHVARFRRRFQQLTGPVMAKSLEDTLFYRYVRFLTLNEVGGEPSRFGIAPDIFHNENAARAESWPQAQIASTTHDTKRSEDARSRLMSLSEIPARWAEAVAQWNALTGAAAAPDGNDRYMILQTILGAWPLELLDDDPPDVLKEFRARVGAYLTKALREGKRHTKWVEPNEAYENDAQALLDKLLTPGAPFLAAFRPLAQDLALRGLLNSLARTVLKLTLPGVPDIYQGTEFWDFSMVDPDNRRPVDYRAREAALSVRAEWPELLTRWQSGAVKQQIVRALLADRAAAPGLYAQAGYEPLSVGGARHGNVIAFLRSGREGARIVVVPRLAGGEGRARLPLGEAFWADTTLSLPPGHWQAVLPADGRAFTRDVPLGDLFSNLPAAVLGLTA